MQLPLWLPERLPTEMRFVQRVNHLTDEYEVMVTATVLDQHHTPLGRAYSGTWRSMECDMLPDAAKAASEAFLWADPGSAVTRAVKRVHHEARVHHQRLTDR